MSGDFPLAEICLYNTDSQRQDTIAPVFEKVIRNHNDSIRYCVTTDLEVAFFSAVLYLHNYLLYNTKCERRISKSPPPLRHGVVKLGRKTCGAGGGISLWGAISLGPCGTPTMLVLIERLALSKGPTCADFRYAIINVLRAAN
ncbi:MAG: hypothetical protein ACR5K7_05830 [Symbiopectobacterium sp.]